MLSPKDSPSIISEPATLPGQIDRALAEQERPSKWRSWWRSRLPLVSLVLLAGVVVQGVKQRPPERSLPGLARLLGERAGVEVEQSAIHWEPSAGVLSDLVFGRPLLFLGAKHEGAPRDVYRAFVRVTREGKPLRVGRLRNLTDTEVGDDVGLDLRGTKAAFATVAFGHIQGLSVLDTAGIAAEDKPAGAFDRLLLAVTAFQETGSFKGIGRSDILLEIPVEQLRLSMDSERLSVQLGSEGRGLAFDLNERELSGLGGGEPYAAKSVNQRHFEKPLILWGVDTVRAEVGPAPIAWLENKVFGARDTVKRTTYQLFDKGGAQSELKVEATAASEAVEPAQAVQQLDDSKLKTVVEAWPPPKVPSLWKENKPGEGEWVAVDVPWLAASPAEKVAGGEEPPAYFYQTFIRPDSKRPYSELQLIAMDMRRLELGMEAGFEDPKPLTGPPGSGRLPKEPEAVKRIVATFNGAFKTDHGKYGMMVDRRVLLPPIAGGASIVLTEDKRVGLGSWPQQVDIPTEIVSYRQNLDPLVEDGVANPTGRYIWGWQLAGTSVMTERTALCVTPSGHLYYAWGNDIDGPTLGKALRQAGCNYGIHLDMNPKHCGFVFTKIIDPNKRDYQLQKAHPGMQIAADKFVRWSPKDFFYISLRDPKPKDASGAEWRADGGTQPPPAWWPGIFRADTALGQLQMELYSFEPGRVEWRLLAGSEEFIGSQAGPKRRTLTGDDKHHVIGAVSLGNTTSAVRLGLAFEKEPVVAQKAGAATLVVEDGGVQLLGAGVEVQGTARRHLAQLPLLAERGELLPSAREPGSMRKRGAICVTAEGRVLVALGRHDSSDPLASVLLSAGCRRVAELDRGSQGAASVHRAGTDTPPLSDYTGSTLYALGAPMRPYAFRWKGEGAVPSTRPTSQDYRGPRPKQVH